MTPSISDIGRSYTKTIAVARWCLNSNCAVFLQNGRNIMWKLCTALIVLCWMPSAMFYGENVYSLPQSADNLRIELYELDLNDGHQSQLEFKAGLSLRFLWGICFFWSPIKPSKILAITLISTLSRSRLDYNRVRPCVASNGKICERDALQRWLRCLQLRL